MKPTGVKQWSQLTSLLPSNGASRTHDSQEETGHGDSLPYVWR
jgi:hypothetical protein